MRVEGVATGSAQAGVATSGDIEWHEARADRALRQLRGMALKVTELDGLTGGLSTPDKMPGLCFNLPALVTCNVGRILNRQAGTVCSKCYALKGRYTFPVVIAAMHRRLARLQRNPHVWAAAMVERINRYKTDRSDYFRWHDSGDVLGPGHLRALRWIARQCPGTRFWLPTRESRVVADLVDAPAPNLVTRISAARLKAVAPARHRWTSTVDSGVGHRCPASQQGGRCWGEVKKCTACWNPCVANTDYPLH